MNCACGERMMHGDRMCMKCASMESLRGALRAYCRYRDIPVDGLIGHVRFTHRDDPENKNIQEVHMPLNKET